MNLISLFFGYLFKLPPAETRDIMVDRAIPVPMPDGVTLLTDHYYPRSTPRLPTILVRSPYGRGSVWGLLFGWLFAERGFQVVIQSCRGTFGSGGTFDPYHNERSDGLATVEWMKAQPWFSGELATVGPSYLGFVQWAIADAAPELKAMGIQISASDFHARTYSGGSFGLDTALAWINIIAHQEESVRAANSAKAKAALQAAAMHLPLLTVDEVAVGKPMPFLRDWLQHDQTDDAWWTPVIFTDNIPKVQAPVTLLGGWYDIFLPQTLADYEALRQAGKHPYLTVGPWAHTNFGWMPVAVRDSLAWFRAYLKNDRSGLRAKPVRLHVMGSKQWRDYESWPPPGYAPQRWHLQADRALTTAVPQASPPDRYHYDPADPTPAVGGVTLGENNGPKDNRALEARSDVLTYTSAVLTQDVEVIGDVKSELYVQSSLQYTDFFARLCDVDASGKSVNICDGLQRLTPNNPAPSGNGSLKIEIALWPTAHCFKRGHRIRLQVSSGAHPRYVRNPGTGEPLATATKLIAADQTVYHDPQHPSAVILPVKS